MEHRADYVCTIKQVINKRNAKHEFEKMTLRGA